MGSHFVDSFSEVYTISSAVCILAILGNSMASHMVGLKVYVYRVGKQCMVFLQKWIWQCLEVIYSYHTGSHYGHLVSESIPQCWRQPHHKEGNTCLRDAGEGTRLLAGRAWV